MKPATVYLGSREKALITSYTGSSFKNGAYLRKSLELAGENPLQYREFTYYPCNKNATITTYMPESAYDMLVEKPATQLGLTKHTYVANVFFTQLSKDFDISYENISDCKQQDDVCKFLNVPMDIDHFQILYNLRKNGLPSNIWAKLMIHQYQDSRDLVRPFKVHGSRTERLHLRISTADTLKLRHIATLNTMTVPDVIQTFVDLTDEAWVTKNAQHFIDTSRRFNSDKIISSSTFNKRFYKSLITTITVYDPVRLMHISRTFSDKGLAEYVYNHCCKGDYDFVECKKLSDDQRIKYDDINVKFEDCTVVQHDVNYSDSMIHTY